MRLLFVGDVFARPGLRMVETHVPRLRDELELDLVVANGENLADGAGITSRQARRLFACGVDAVTLGNHAFRRAEVYGYLGTEPRIVRPANMSSRSPGHGSVVVASGRRISAGRALVDGLAVPGSRGVAVRGGGAAGRRSARSMRRGARGHACRGHQREGRDGAAAAGQGDGRDRHAHPCPDERRDRAARRNGLHHRRRHDRAARLGDRRPRRTRPAAVCDGRTRAVRAGRRRRAPGGRRDRLRAADGRATAIEAFRLSE